MCWVLNVSATLPLKAGSQETFANLPARHKPVHELRCSLKHGKDSDLHLDYLHRHMAGGDTIGKGRLKNFKRN